MKTYIINLPNSTDRKEHAINELKYHNEFDCEFIDAIYGKNLSKDELYTLVDTESNNSHFKNNINKPEIGCALSHIKCYEQLLKSSEEFVLILEDDILIGKDIDTILPNLYNIAKAPIPTIILLSPNFYYKKENKINNKYSIAKVTSGFTAIGYIINREAAKILIKKLQPIHSVADNWGYFRSFSINIYGVIPHPISWLSRDEIESTITPINKYIYDNKQTNKQSNISSLILKGKSFIKSLIFSIKREKRSNRIWWNSNRIEKGF